MERAHAAAKTSRTGIWGLLDSRRGALLDGLLQKILAPMV